MAENNAQETTPGTTGTSAQPQTPGPESLLFDDIMPSEGSGAPTPEPFAISKAPKAPETPKPTEAAPQASPAEKTASPAVQSPTIGSVVKPIKVKYLDQELEYAPDKLVVPTPVNGKDESPTLQDLRDNWAGKTNWSKRFEEVSRREKNLAPRERQAAIVEQQMSEFAALIKADKHKEFVDAVVKKTGGDPQVFWESLRAEILPDEYTEEQRELLRLRRENGTLRKQATEATAENSRTVQSVQTDREIAALMSQNNISREELKAGWEEITELAQAGSLPQEDLAVLQKADILGKARHTISRIVLGRQVQKVISLADEIDPAIKTNEEALTHLFAINAAGASDEALQRVARLYATPSGQPQEPAPQAGEQAKPAQPAEQKTASVERAQYKKPDPGAGVLFDDL